MTQDFYKNRLADRGIEALIPDAADVDVINTVIFEELFIGELKEKGAEGVILGCTELGLLIRQSDVSVPLFDTTVIHAKRAAQIAMEDCVQR